MHTILFIIAHDEVIRTRRGAGTTRSTFYLGRPSWFVNRLEHVQLRNPTPATEGHVFGFIRVRQGDFDHGPLQYWTHDDEVQLLLNYYNRPPGAFSVIIENVWLLDTPVRVRFLRN